MLHPSTQKLIDRLAAMTAQKKIDWIEKDNGEVIYATEGYVVRLTPEPPRVLLTTENGKSLEDATTSLLTSAVHANGGTYGDLVASIARDACREARGTEDAINTLLAGLSDTEEDVAAEDEADAASDEADEELVVAAAGPDEEAMEDAGDETNVLASDEAETADTEPSDPWNHSEDLVDVSVPEAALVGEDEALDENDEDDVSGAVARLAEEVNSAEAASEAQETEVVSEPDTFDADEPALEADSEDTAFEDASGQEIHGIDDFPALPDTDAAEAEPVSAAEAEAPSFEEDETQSAEEDVAEDASDTPLPAFTVMPDEGQTFDIEDDPDAIDTLAGSDLPSNEPFPPEEVAPDFAEAAVEAEPAEVEAEAEAEADGVTEPAVAAAPASEDNVVRYVPFGAAFASPRADDAPEEVVSEAPSFAAPDTDAVADMDASPDVELPAESDETVMSAPEVETPVEAAPPVAPSIAPVPQPATTLSISGFSAGLGFGATQSGFTPTPPKPAESPADGEMVSRPSVVIDATDDFPNDFSGAAESGLPDVSDLDLPDEIEDEASFLDAPAPAETAEAAAPEAPAEPASADTDIVEEVEEFPARPKTRFNPWT